MCTELDPLGPYSRLVAAVLRVSELAVMSTVRLRRIHVNTERHRRGGGSLEERVQAMVRDAVSHLSDRITRIEVHLSDENSERSGDKDKRCMLAARVGGLRPIAVTHQAETLALAIDGAAEKLERTLESTLGRLSS